MSNQGPRRQKTEKEAPTTKTDWKSNSINLILSFPVFFYCILYVLDGAAFYTCKDQITAFKNNNCPVLLTTQEVEEVSSEASKKKGGVFKSLLGGKKDSDSGSESGNCLLESDEDKMCFKLFYILEKASNKVPFFTYYYSQVHDELMNEE